MTIYNVDWSEIRGNDGRAEEGPESAREQG